MNKKRYAGLMWTQVEKYDYMDTKGLETVRRDNCALVRDVIQTSLNKIIISRDVPGAINFVKSQIADLLQNKMDISQLVITKSLNKGAEYALGLGGNKDDYKMKQAHVELAARMRKRDPGSAPQMGDRVPYVIITAAKGAANFEKAEDPIYVLENNIPIDSKWYLTNQLSKPLTRIFEPIIDNVEKSLLQGEHTRKIFIPTPTAKKGSLMMFASKSARCMGCKVNIKADEGTLCKYCLPKEAQIYLEKLDALKEAELRYAHLWSEAQRIHGTLHTDVRSSAFSFFNAFIVCDITNMTECQLSISRSCALVTAVLVSFIGGRKSKPTSALLKNKLTNLEGKHIAQQQALQFGV